MINYISVILAGGENIDFRDQRVSESKLQFCINGSSTLLHEIYREYISPRKTIIASLNEDKKFFESDESFGSATFIEIRRNTAGALATLGLTVDHIDGDVPILVAPGDGLVFDRIVPFMNEMATHRTTAGLIVFPSTNTNYSYVRSVGNLAIEVAEKKVIGSLATTGIYYFKDKKVLLECLKWVLVNRLHFNGLYYLSVGINQLIAQKKQVRLFEIDEREYFRFATPDEALSSKERLSK
jgi:dTDP-glucose pyrophosphorylase